MYDSRYVLRFAALFCVLVRKGHVVLRQGDARMFEEDATSPETDVHGYDENAAGKEQKACIASEATAADAHGVCTKESRRSQRRAVSTKRIRNERRVRRRERPACLPASKQSGSEASQIGHQSGKRRKCKGIFVRR